MLNWNLFYKQLKTHNMTKKILQLVVVLLIAAQGVMAQTSQIYDVTVAPGDITVQVDMLGYSDVGAITFYLKFDSDLMDFTGISDTQLTGNWLANYNANNERIIVTYTAAAGTTNLINGKAFDLDFSYKGGFGTDITFDTTYCEITTGGLQAVPTTYIDGSVSQTAAVGTVSMSALTETPGTTISMPVNMAGSGFATVGSLTYMISFDEFQMSFAGIVEDDVTGVVASANDGVLEITWTGGGTAVDLSAGHPFDVQFEYNGGSADVAFIAGCEVDDNSAGALAVDYTDGTVTATAGTASFTIGDVGATPGTAVVVPIASADFGATVVGAITMIISYDAAACEYTGYTAQQLSGWVVNSSVAGEVTLEWSSATGSTLLDENLVLLNFNYDSAGTTIPLQFEPGTFVKDVSLAIVPVSYYHGSIASYTVSGQLTYFGDASRPIGTSGSTATMAYLKHQSDSTIAYTTTTDADGNFIFENVGNGDFFLDATTTIDATLAYDMTDAFIIYGTGASLTGLKQLAADVNEIGGVDMTDAFIVYGSWQAGNVKVSSWTAPDWFFDNIAITVAADVSQDFSGIASGDANADFVPIP